MFLYSLWCELPINKRHEIANHLGIKKKGSTHVVDNQIVSDGYLIKEVEAALTVEGLSSYLGTGEQEKDLHVLWDMLIHPENYQVVVSGTLDKEFGVQPLKPEKKGGRPKGSKNK